MKQSWKLTICLAFILMLASFTQASTTKNVTGNYCGQEEAGDGAYFYFMVNVRNSVMEFSVPDITKVKILNSKIKNIWEIPLGSEVTIKYVVKKGEKVLSSITLTGKVNKKTKSCSP